MWIIYKVQFPNGKVYIGQTKDTLEKRRKNHWNDASYELKKNIHYKFHDALLKHGFSPNNDQLEWYIIDSANSIEEALQKEASYIEQYDSINNGYNCRTSQNGKGFVDDNTKQKIANKVGPLSKEMWEESGRKEEASERMKLRHANGLMDEAKIKSTEVRSTEEQRKLTSEDNVKRYSNLQKRNDMARNHGTKPFLVYKGDVFIGRFENIHEAYRQLNIPNNGHISTILKRGKGTLYGYNFVYENRSDDTSTTREET